VKRIHGIRGATTVERDDAGAVIEATRELLAELLRRNDAGVEDVVSAFFTVTADLRSDFPARAARESGWDNVAMLCGVEVPVPGALTCCIRVLLHVELPAEVNRMAVRHVYLRGAQELRPDLR